MTALYVHNFHSHLVSFSPGISPGAAAPLELLPEISTLSNVPASAASGFSGLVVHEQIHLCMTNLLQVTFEGVNRADFNCSLWQTVPSVQNSYREEIQSCIASTVCAFDSFHLWPRVHLPSASWKYVSSGTDEMPRIILNNSIKSVRLRHFMRCFGAHYYYRHLQIDVAVDRMREFNYR